MVFLVDFLRGGDGDGDNNFSNRNDNNNYNNIKVNYQSCCKERSRFGSKSTAAEVTEGLDLSDYTVIVTGATSGIGAEVGRVLAKRGATVVMPARNVKAAIAVKESVQAQQPNAKIIVMEMDLSSFDSIRSFAKAFLDLGLPLHILINNAGVYCKSFQLSVDGYEMNFATNHLGHFLLTNLLLERMILTAKDLGIEGRIVNVSSCLHTWAGHSGIPLHSINDKQSFVESISYARSKLANILHAKELSRRLKEAGAHVSANAVHPGIVKTNITRDRGGLLTDIILRVASIFMKSIPQGAATVCYVATHPKVLGTTGKYFVDCNESECSSSAGDNEQALHLWLYSENATNV